ncbi:unnamed protein product [Closterium sp. NIES-54]
MSATGTPPRRIVVAIDDSTGSTEALQWALDNMQLQPGRDTIVLVNTQSYSAAPTSRPGKTILPGQTRVMIGDARLSISEAAEQAKADAVVVGSRGHGALKRLVLGSVSEYCAHHCPMPVIIVRPNKIGQPDPAVPMD